RRARLSMGRRGGGDDRGEARWGRRRARGGEPGRPRRPRALAAAEWRTLLAVVGAVGHSAADRGGLRPRRRIAPAAGGASSGAARLGAPDRLEHLAVRGELVF